MLRVFSPQFGIVWSPLEASHGSWARCALSKVFFFQGDKHYDAFKKDIAVVNVYFGDSTVFGETMLITLCCLITVAWLKNALKVIIVRKIIVTKL